MVVLARTLPFMTFILVVLRLIQTVMLSGPIRKHWTFVVGPLIISPWAVPQLLG